MPRKTNKRILNENRGKCLVEHRKKQRLEDIVREQKHEEEKQRLKLAYDIDKHLTRVQGQIICKGEIKQVLRLYFHLVIKEHKDPEYAVRYVSEVLGISEYIVKNARDEFVEDHTIRSRDGSRRGGTRGIKAPPGTTFHLRQKIEEMLNEGRRVTAVSLQSWLASEPSEEQISSDVKTPPEEKTTPKRIPIHVSHGTVRNWLHSLGFHVAKGKSGYKLTEDMKNPIG